MPIAHSARVHPSAVVDPRADLGDEVTVGPHAVIEADVRVGPGCKIGPGVHLLGMLTMGQGNEVYSHAVLGDRPQHLKYQGEPTRVEIGDCNVIREHVTIHRGTTQSWVTRLGSHNFLMASSHIAHDCTIGDHCLLANGALVGGHCEVASHAYLSGNCALHQFVRVGRLALLSGVSASSKDIPPFVIQQGINTVWGVNVVGMRRAGIPTERIDAVRRAFHLLYRGGYTIPQALAQMEAQLPGVPEVVELADFIRHSARGIAVHGIVRSEAA
jgi:UDP-N-acetylglucosamine acyltransferase